ncbi:MAG: hypothetical protein KAU31_07425 [Spirochaetaceae bacterium]|nr:hypothetical protein [Spirochaetaceae bacterium]
MNEDTAHPNDFSGTLPPSPLEGHFLASETELPGLDFRQTVVLIINHNEEDVFGLVVTRSA